MCWDWTLVDNIALEKIARWAVTGTKVEYSRNRKFLKIQICAIVQNQIEIKKHSEYLETCPYDSFELYILRE